MATLVLDAGALILADRADDSLWRAIRGATEVKLSPVVPAGALAQAWRHPQQARLAVLLKLCRVDDLDADAARRAGELCARAGTDDVVDASVVMSAIKAGPSVIFTTDPRDIGVLVDVLPEGVGRPTVRAF